MKLDRITLTGIDDNTKPRDLIYLQTNYPFVEFGILFSPKRAGHTRYPSEYQIDMFCHSYLNLSAHLCGQYSRDVMEKGDLSIFQSLSRFERVQINYNFNRGKGWSFEPILLHARRNPGQAIIFQFNDMNNKAISEMLVTGKDFKNIHILYDSSGGAGRLIDVLYPPFSNYTGYAGGINPDNIQNTIAGIDEIVSTKTAWLDMESGIRTNDRFDFGKAKYILETCNPHIA